MPRESNSVSVSTSFKKKTVSDPSFTDVNPSLWGHRVRDGHLLRDLKRLVVAERGHSKYCSFTSSVEVAEC